MRNCQGKNLLLPLVLCLWQMPGLAQIVPDGTLPNNTIVTPLPDNRNEITGGTPVDSNLFHSFQEFSVETGSTAYFNNSVEIRNIFSRVTGDSTSNIDGIIRANGSANLFIINPNGIIFGRNAQLEIGGSFLGTTAESINFADGTQFSATNPQAPPLLTINVPIGLQFGARPREIVVEGTGHALTANPERGFAIVRNQPRQSLQVNTGQTLALVGGDVTLRGGNLIAESGRIELGSVGGNSIVNVNQTAADLSLGYEGVQNFQDIQLSGRSAVDASGEGGGNIQVQGRRVTVAEDSLILSLTEGFLPGGELSVNASESVAVIATGENPVTPSSLLTETQGIGAGGNLTITTGQLTFQNGAQASSSSFSPGRGGNLSVTASESIELTGTTLQGRPSSLAAGTVGLAEGGKLNIATDRLIVQQGATVSTTTLFGDRAAGDISIDTRELIVREGAQIRTDTIGAGNAGNLFISADEVELRGVGVQPSGLFSQVEALRGERGEIVGLATGKGGNLTIETGELRVLEGAQISTGTFGGGEGGSVTVNASESVEVMGTGTTIIPEQIPQPSLVPSAITAVTVGSKDAGNLTIETERLIVRDGGQLTAATRGPGRGGTLSVTADDSVEVSGVAPDDRPSRLTARTEGPGDAGNLNIDTSRLTVGDGGEINVSGVLRDPNGAIAPREGLGAAGNLNIDAADIMLDNRGSLRAETTTRGLGNIEVNAEDMRLQNGSQITANAQNTTGGNITIDTNTLVALENSDITANAQAGPGGRVRIEAEGIFGTEFRDRPSVETSDITATSNLGPEFEGIVEINTPDVDPSAGLVKFDNDVVDIEALIEQNSCKISEESQFIITGRGGLPPSPNDPLVPTIIPEASTETNPQESEVSTWPSKEQIVEAQGWIVNADGKVELVANPPKITPHSPWYISPDCQDSRKNMPDRPSVKSLRDKIVVKEFHLLGSSVFPEERLEAELQDLVGKEIAFAELLEARSRITKLYVQNQYMTSGAYIPLQTIENDVVKVQVVEGKLAERDIEVTTSGNLSESWVKKRLLRATKKALNQEKLIAELQMLQLEAGIEVVQAELYAGIRPGTNVLEVNIIEAHPLSLQVTADNGRSPSVGSFRRGGSLSYANLLGTGDRLRVGYTNTEGSDEISAGYAVPLNARNSTLEIRYASGESNVVERPFDRIDIEANSRTYSLTYREPLVRTPLTELALGLTASRRESETSLLGVDFPLSPGANDDGETRLSVLRFYQDWAQRGKKGKYLFAVRSEFNLGVGWFDATVNSSGPDSRFFSWRGQGQWVRSLADDSFLVVRGNVQLSPSDLVPLEEFGIGGLGTVRGYRQDTLLTDNGVFGSVEAWIPVVRFRQGRDGVLQVTPFVDLGTGWRSDGQANPDKNVLVSTGIGLRLRLPNQLTVRLDWGIPLVDRDSQNRTWQENGIYFSITSSPF